MIVIRKLKLIRPLLAMKRDHLEDGPKRVFIKENPKEADPNKVHIRTYVSRWNWAFLEARDCLDIPDVATSAIIPARYFTVSKTSTYNRSYKVGRQQKKERFESLPSGQKFDMRFTIASTIPPGTDGMGRFTRTPDIDEFDAMLAYIGENFGMSEFGHAHLYGLFSVEDETQTQEKIEKSNNQQGRERDVRDSGPG